MRGPVGRSLELLATVDVAAVQAADGGLDRDGRALRGLPEPGREPGPSEGAIGGVDVPILDLA